MQNSIERSIEINAPLERVWQLVTEPGWWVPSDYPVDARREAGHVVVRESQKWGRFPVEVVELLPMTYAAFRWAPTFPGDDLASGRTTLVEFTLRPGDVDDSILVSVTESGFAFLDAPDDIKRKGVESNTDGWKSELDTLRDRAEA